jgi:hypothetical protein
VQRSYDCAVRERELSFLKGLYRDIVPQLRAQLLELASYSYQLINRDQAPVTISGRDCNAIDRGSLSPACGWPSMVLCAVDFVT